MLGAISFAVSLATFAPSGSASAEASASASTDGTASADARGSADAEKDKRWIKRYLPERHTIELGVWVGPLFTSRRHEFYDPNAGAQLRFKPAALDLGLRFGYYP